MEQLISDAPSDPRTFRRVLYSIVVGEEDGTNSALHRAYTIAMTMVIILSLVPLAFRDTNPMLSLLEYGCVLVFIFDFAVRWATADIKYGCGLRSILFYPLRPMAIIDLLSILPIFTSLNNTFNLCRATRLIKTARLLKIARVAPEFELFFVVLAEKRVMLLTVLALACVYILFTALLMFNIDEHFANFFDAVYWATTTLTTVGYGDVLPHNNWGRVLSMISSVVGVAVIALPSGIITAGYLKALEDIHKEKGERHDNVGK